MRDPLTVPGSPDAAGPPAWRAAVILLALIAVVVTIGAHAPSHTYAYAQLWNIGAGIGMLDSGEWLLPRDQLGLLARKPPLLAWLIAGAVRLTGLSEDLVFRLPTILAAVGTAALTYLLAARWFARRTALLAGVLWVGIFHQNKAMYLATTDMLLTLWLTASIYCADRMLFCPASRPRRRRWAMAFWAAMILAAMTKGWGLVNIALVGLWLLLAVVLGPGLRGLGGRQAVRTVGRRFWYLLRATKFAWGMAALLAVIGGTLAAMYARQGEGLMEVLGFEVGQRVTGGGVSPPSASTAPPVASLLYYALPASLFALVALVLAAQAGDWAAWRESVRGRRIAAAVWRGGTTLLSSLSPARSPIGLPLLWIVAVVLPFSLVHGFRPDYLFPCYPAVAMMGAWALATLAKRDPKTDRSASLLRHVCAAPPVLFGAVLVLLPPVFLLHDRMPAALQKAMPLPRVLRDETVWLLAALPVLGAILLELSISASLRWRLRRLGVCAAIGSIGVMFLYTHTLSRHARTGKGEAMLTFSRDVRAWAASDRVAISDGVGELAVEVYLGRFGEPVGSVETLASSGARWLVITDNELATLGGATSASGARYAPGDLGWVVARSEPIKTETPWGRMYLIRLDPRSLARRLGRREAAMNKVEVPQVDDHVQAEPGDKDGVDQIDRVGQQHDRPGQ